VLVDPYTTPEPILAENPILVISGYLDLDQMNDIGLGDLGTVTAIAAGKRFSLHALKSFTGAEMENYYLYRLSFDTGE